VKRGIKMNVGYQAYNVILGILLLVWVIIEYRIMGKKEKRPMKKDIAVLLMFSILISSFCLFSYHLFSENLGMIIEWRHFFFWLGIIVVIIGILIRQYSMFYMGNNYVATLQIQEKQKLISSGPFKVVRHPCYSGFMLSLWGLGLASLNYIFLILIIIYSLLLFLLQINIEEKELERYFKEEYIKYKRETKKIIPFLI
jgi:protein-S-isoprenylcysteine O-methyltransferase Ste14